MFNELRGRVDELSKIFNKEIGNVKMEIENIKKNEWDMKNIITEMKNTLEGINSKFDETENWISNLEDKVAENIQSEQKREKELKMSII